MIQFLKKLTAATMITLVIGVVSVMASGKMEVKIGERVDLVGESSMASPQYKWVVKKGNDILTTQTNRNFGFKFENQGEYVVNLTATSGSNIENTTINVLAGERYPRPLGEDGLEEVIPPGEMPPRLVLETLPRRSDGGRIVLLGDDGKVSFLLEQSIGEILEYRIDKNVFEDSDGNGVANDDIDNSDDNSYLTGQSWQAEYKADESTKIVTEITLVDKNGKKSKEQIEIVFDERIETGDPVAILDISPESDPKDNLVHLYQDPHKVTFYARRSTGKIIEYRIDKNIFVDSNGDGNPENDIDNLNDISFKTGDVWEAEYEKTDDQIISQLIVVGEGGKGSRIQKGIVFGDKPPPPVIPITSPEVEGAIRLTADKDLVVKGDPITFTIKGLQFGLDQYTFEWDFDGDGEVDKEIEGQDSVEHIYEFPGVFEAKVKIIDQEGNSAERTFEITSKDTEVTKSDFTFDIEGSTVTFANQSTVATNLANKTLDYQWSFGDTDEAGYESQKGQIGMENPVYTYNRAGKYLITLTVTDADQVTDSKSVEVEILQDLVPTGEQESAKEKKDGESSLFIKLFKFFLYLILIVIALVIMIVGGFLIFFKVQHPDLTFDELVDELKVKLLTIMGVHEIPDAAPGDELPKPPAGTGTATGTATEPEPEPEPEPETPAPEPEQTEEEVEPVTPEEPPVTDAGPTPDWLKGKEVIEGEVADESAVEPAEEAPAKPPAPESPIGEPEGPANGEGKDKTPPSEPPSGPPPPEPPAGGGGGSEPPAPETDAPSSEKGPVPDWLKGV